jgi:hypothetical protein
MTEGQKWTYSMARAKNSNQHQHPYQDQVRENGQNSLKTPQGGELPSKPKLIPSGPLESSLAESLSQIPEGLISLLAEKFTAIKEGVHDLASVGSLLMFLRNTPVFWNNPSVPAIVRKIELGELKTTSAEEKISWRDFIKYFSLDPRHAVLPRFGRQPFDSTPRDAEYENTIDEAEKAIKKVFQACMDGNGQVNSQEFFDKLKENPAINSAMSLHIAPVMPSASYLPLTIQENVHYAAKESPAKMDFNTFTSLFRKVQYPPGKFVENDQNRPLLSDRSEKILGQIRRPYKAGDQSSIQSVLRSTQLENQMHDLSPVEGTLKQLGWADLLFPKSYRALPQGHHHIANHPDSFPTREGVDPKTYLGISNPSPQPTAGKLGRGDSLHIGGPVKAPVSLTGDNQAGWQGFALPKPHPLHPVTDSKPGQLAIDALTTRRRLEDRLTEAVRHQIESTVEIDRRREAVRRKLEDEEKTKQAKEAMYSDLKAKYQAKLESGVHASKKKINKPKPVVESQVLNKEGERRRKMQEVMRLQQEGLEHKLTEEETILLKEALLLRRMGKL